MVGNISVSFFDQINWPPSNSTSKAPVNPISFFRVNSSWPGNLASRLLSRSLTLPTYPQDSLNSINDQMNYKLEKKTDCGAHQWVILILRTILCINFLIFNMISKNISNFHLLNFKISIKWMSIKIKALSTILNLYLSWFLTQITLNETNVSYLVRNNLSIRSYMIFICAGVFGYVPSFFIDHIDFPWSVSTSNIVP